MLCSTAALLFFYGLFLIVCGVMAVVFIGWKSKTALASGGLSGILAMTAGHFVNSGSQTAKLIGIFLSLALFCVFSWRSTKTLFALLALVKSGEDVKGKSIAFLIISLMAVVSIFVTLWQTVNYVTGV